MMGPSENEDDAKKTGARLEPLCLFCFPDESPSAGGKTYVRSLEREGRERGGAVEERPERREPGGFWPRRKRAEPRIRRRRAKEPIRNLRAYLLTSVREESCGGVRGNLPSLLEALETVKDAWPSPSNGGRSFLRKENRRKVDEREMKSEGMQTLVNRRFSMPEELMRKYSVSREKTSEESEETKTAVEVTPSSSSRVETARRMDGEERKEAEAWEQTSGEGGVLPQRVTQSEYYKQGQRVIKVRGGGEKCRCRGEAQSSTTVSAKDETDDSGTSESLVSSSPTQLPKRESSSGNLSSESDNLRCTCAELTSKETSTDLYFSGKSTLSQTVSDKSVSTQDSTVSMNSVSSRGSTVSDGSNSTTPEVERTSAKETTTSTDYSPRTPRNRKSRRRGHHATCPRHGDAPDATHQCPVHSSPREPPPKANAATNTDGAPLEAAEGPQPERKPEGAGERYQWAKLSQEELYMMQQLRHRKFVESQRKLSVGGLPPTPDADSIASCGTGTAYPETEPLDRPVMIPRYSALPRSLSMLVNTSSPDTSHHSDSDNQSLADSLEDQPVTHVHKLYFDTKNEAKPVRGDASLPEENRLRHKQPRGRAFFVSIKEPFGEDEMLENIEKIPQPPEKIKNQISRRHLRLCAKHRQLHHPEEAKEKKKEGQKGRRTGERGGRGRKAPEEGGKKAGERRTERTKRKEEETAKAEETKSRGKEGRGKSKIPVPVSSSRSTSSSPERDAGKREKSVRGRGRLRREKEGEGVGDPPAEVETTQILEITHSGAELGLQKPQAVIHPSQVPLELKPSPPLVIPPLVPALRMPPIRQGWSKPILAPARRSPIGKFRQRFEVIPEEKSSSLSSAEEKTGGGLRKFADAATSPVPSEGCGGEAPNLIVAKIANRQLDSLPYVLFSSKPQNSNSCKGRDALIAMNREDFNRLAKGWMSFYKLNENAEGSETEGRSREGGGRTERRRLEQAGGESTTGGERQDPGDPPETKEKMAELGENIRFDSSNTILRGGKGGWWEEEAAGVAEDDTDSDSTDYMEPPSPRVPPLPINDIPSNGSLSSSDSEPEPRGDAQPLNPPKRRPVSNRNRLKKDNPFGAPGKKKNSGWSVTVAGTVELSRSAPDLEMRLSFPGAGGPPVVSQSDSGFAEEPSYPRARESLEAYRRELPMGRGKQKWMVTVKNPKAGDAGGVRKSEDRLPQLEPSRNNPLKDGGLEEEVKRLVEGKMEAIWPEVQRVIRREFSRGSEVGRLMAELEGGAEECLSVRGSAVSLERKRKPPTMTERDVTRRWSPRGEEAEAEVERSGRTDSVRD